MLFPIEEFFSWNSFHYSLYKCYLNIYSTLLFDAWFRFLFHFGWMESECFWKLQLITTFWTEIEYQLFQSTCLNWFSTLITKITSCIIRMNFVLGKGCSGNEEMFWNFEIDIFWNWVTTQSWWTHRTIYSK